MAPSKPHQGPYTVLMGQATILRKTLTDLKTDPARSVMARSQLKKAEERLIDVLSGIIEARNGEKKGGQEK